MPSLERGPVDLRGLLFFCLVGVGLFCVSFPFCENTEHAGFGIRSSRHPLRGAHQFLLKKFQWPAHIPNLFPDTTHEPHTSFFWTTAKINKQHVDNDQWAPHQFAEPTAQKDLGWWVVNVNHHPHYFGIQPLTNRCTHVLVVVLQTPHNQRRSCGHGNVQEDGAKQAPGENQQSTQVGQEKQEQEASSEGEHEGGPCGGGGDEQDDCRST